MTVVRISNSNTSVATPRYIQIHTAKVEDVLDHEVVHFPLPVAPANWLDGGGNITMPQRIIFDLKQIQLGYQINGVIDVDSNRDSGWNVSTVSDVNVVKSYLKEIAMTGGVVNLYLVYTGGSSSPIEGVITNLSFTEEPSDQNVLDPPETLGVSMAFLVGQNAET